MEPIKLKQRRVWMHKGVMDPDFSAMHVLSDNPWKYVELWLKRKKSNSALAYWAQARRFAEASSLLSTEAAPLTLYYSFLNSVKALLVHKNIDHGRYHGVTGERPTDARASLANEIVRFQTGGVLPALCKYFGESAQGEELNLKDIMYNIPYIHRAFCLTYRSAPELLIPLENVRYVRHPNSREAWLAAEIAPRYCDGRTLATLPRSFETYQQDGKTIVRRKKRFRWFNYRDNRVEKDQALQRLKKYHASSRRIIVNISGNRDLWYIKKSMNRNTAASRHTTTLIFAGMHRLSELSRYDPAGFDRHLAGQANWLLTEFIEHAMDQFIDQIASEITGYQFWRPKLRT